MANVWMPSGAGVSHILGSARRCDWSGAIGKPGWSILERKALRSRSSVKTLNSSAKRPGSYRESPFYARADRAVPSAELDPRKKACGDPFTEPRHDVPLGLRGVFGRQSLFERLERGTQRTAGEE